jgi:hypothetical protein
MDDDIMLKALAHPFRRDVLAWLKEPELHFAPQADPLDMGVCASQFDYRGVAQSSVSVHWRHWRQPPSSPRDGSSNGCSRNATKNPSRPFKPPYPISDDSPHSVPHFESMKGISYDYPV